MDIGESFHDGILAITSLLHYIYHLVSLHTASVVKNESRQQLNGKGASTNELMESRGVIITILLIDALCTITTSLCGGIRHIFKTISNAKLVDIEPHLYYESLDSALVFTFNTFFRNLIIFFSRFFNVLLFEWDIFFLLRIVGLIQTTPYIGYVTYRKLGAGRDYSWMFALLLLLLTGSGCMSYLAQVIHFNLFIAILMIIDLI